MPDAVEPFRDAVQQEAPDEAVRGQGHGAVGRPVAGLRHRLAPAEGDGVAVEGQQPGIGDGDAMGVAREIPDHGLGAVERPFRVDLPACMADLLHLAGEGAGVREMRDGPVEGEPPVSMGLGELLDEAPPEAAREHLDGGEEPVAPDLPFAGGDAEPGVRHQAVQVRMPIHPLVPGVQHGGSAGPGGEARGIGADGAQGLGGDPEEDVEDRPSVLQRDPGDRPGQREDDMEVRDRQDAAGLP